MLQLLETVTIGRSVTRIGDNAFNGCEALKNVVFEGTTEEWNKISIGSGNEQLINALNIQGGSDDDTVRLSYNISNGLCVVSPSVVPADSRIVCACYLGNKQVFVDFCKYNGGQSVTFNLPEQYDSIKVMAFEDFCKLKPLCVPGSVNDVQ